MNKFEFNTINVYGLSTSLNTPAAKNQIRKKFDEPKTPKCNLNYISKLEIFWKNGRVSVVSCSIIADRWSQRGFSIQIEQVLMMLSPDKKSPIKGGKPDT